MRDRQRGLLGPTSMALGDRLASAAQRYRLCLGGGKWWKGTAQFVRVCGSGLSGVNSGATSARTAEGTRSVEGLGAAAVSTAEGIDAAVARVEAALFLSQEPLSPRKLALLADLTDGTQACTLVEELRRRLRHRGSALQPVEVAGGFLLMTRPHLADWLAKLHGHPEAWRLSAPALEALAVVAYRQPILRGEIEAIRGVQCGELLRMLMEKGFLRIVGRGEELGRPLLYGTTRKFLEVFGLRRLEELPPIDQISGTPPIEANSGEGRSQFIVANS